MAGAALVLTIILAAANGANDVSKGVATLVASGLASVRVAIAWGIATTAAGGLLAAFASQGLVQIFSGAGIVNGTPAVGPFFLAVAVGAVLWLAVATAMGLPVSTTHSLFGALIGVALMHQGAHAVAWHVAATKVVAPLLLSPILSAALVLAVLPAVRRGFARFGSACVCVEETQAANLSGCAAASVTAPTPAVVAAPKCDENSIVRLRAADTMHWLSSGAVSFFRGMNDVPKIVAVGLAGAVATGMSVVSVYLAVAIAMSCGALAGQRVLRTLAFKVTRMEPDTGLAANAVTAMLGGAASGWSLPVSTTHVSSGAIFGIGASRQSALDWSSVREIASAWAITLPASALLAGIAFVVMSAM